MDLYESFMSGGATWKPEHPGDTVTGTVLTVDQQQMQKFRNGQPTGEPDTWDNGQPKMQASITLQTTLREDANDNGQRVVYIKTWGAQKFALQKALKAVGRMVQAGDTFTASFLGLGEAQGGMSAPKLFEYTVTAGTQAALAQAFDVTPSATAPQSPPAVAQSPATSQTSTPTPAANQAAAQPAATPAAAPSQQNGIDMAKALIAGGIPDDAAIAAQTGLSPSVVTMLRAAA